MISDQPTRRMRKEFAGRGWTVKSTDGRHTKYSCSCGRHSFALPTSHGVVSPGVVRKARQAMDACDEERRERS